VSPADELIQLREALSLSQRRCAALLRVHPQTVKNWESARTRVPFVAIFVLRTLYEEKSK